ncbi:hypothetical protein C440_06812 [Haloferax mucosum ATCC BAA-1512]|uniref:Lipoprotein n=1 Tax=Haloferax mucosum ATCC BAA-1512 TaxID=662479 RepID=M0IDA4_9EURY|nr:hypothetical protein [Haloferax mucosum]ELZ94765.1 hypothetical protein C440_06812 [Haloferax mucosum ATCC BAA-1512]
MKRRALLVGAAGLCATLAGCTNDGDDGNDSDGDDEQSPTATETTTPTETPAHPRLVGRTLSPETARNCSPDGQAQISHTTTGVEISGCIWGRNGCSVARLGRTDYDVEADVATVVVETVEDAEPGEACTQAIVVRGYVVQLRFEVGLPEQVVVVHDDANGRREVARRTRNESESKRQ